MNKKHFKARCLATLSREWRLLSRPRLGLNTPLLCCLLAWPFSVPAQQRRVARSVTAPAKQRTSSTESAAVSQEDFDKLAAEASAARDSDKLDEAVALYRKALGLRPQWAEGWWYLATLYYDRDNYVEAAQAFKQTAQIQQKAGAPWAMLGLCEFQLAQRSEEHTSELQSQSNLVCRLLLEKQTTAVTRRWHPQPQASAGWPARRRPTSHAARARRRHRGAALAQPSIRIVSQEHSPLRAPHV